MPTFTFPAAFSGEHSCLLHHTLPAYLCHRLWGWNSGIGSPLPPVHYFDRLRFAPICSHGCWFISYFKLFHNSSSDKSFRYFPSNMIFLGWHCRFVEKWPNLLETPVLSLPLGLKNTSLGPPTPSTLQLPTSPPRSYSPPPDSPFSPPVSFS